jgi:hypothetical protein
MDGMTALHDSHRACAGKQEFRADRAVALEVVLDVGVVVLEIHGQVMTTLMAMKEVNAQAFAHPAEFAVIAMEHRTARVIVKLAHITVVESHRLAARFVVAHLANRLQGVTVHAQHFTHRIPSPNAEQQRQQQ